MSENKILPDFLFETSWEVCNKVGGIYTVLSTRAHSLQMLLNDRLLFIGPDIWGDTLPLDFEEDETLFADWKQEAQEQEGLKIRIGRWRIPGKPTVVLVDFNSLFVKKSILYYVMWESYGVDSSKAYGDYDESCMFAIASATVMESFYHFYDLKKKNVVALFNEWMLGMGALYLQKEVPSIATIFTTHATSIGRSIAGNNKPLYAYMDGYNGDQMASELNMEAKHGIEKIAAHQADCFTTVSYITAIECEKLLDKKPDIVTPNGFEPNFVPVGDLYACKRNEARKTLISIAEKLTGSNIPSDALLISTSGRYEYKNKGIDVFIDAVNHVRNSSDLNREVIAFIMVPAWVNDARSDLRKMVQENINGDTPLQHPLITHWLNNMSEDKVMHFMAQCGFENSSNDRLKIVFIPCYLAGEDGIFNKPYYDLLIGMDATIYPSYYEPWGYTPLESIAFGIPTITTNLAGFGLWAMNYVTGNNIQDGVVVINRTDFNYNEVVEAIKENILTLAKITPKEVSIIQEHCFKLAKDAEWNKFIVYYESAFAFAIDSAKKRNLKQIKKEES